MSHSEIPLCTFHELEKYYLQSDGSSPTGYLPESGIRTTSYFSIFLRTETPCKNEIDINRSEFYKILLITKGSGILHYNVDEYEIKPGSLLFLKPIEVKSWRATTTEQEGFYCIFNEQFFACNKMRLYELNTHPLFQTGKSPVLVLGTNQLSAACMLFQSLYEEFNTEGAYSTDICRLYLRILLLQSRRVAHVNRENMTDSPAAIKITAKFNELLEKEISKTGSTGLCLRSPADFASMLCVHPNYLNACVKKVTGKTVHDLIQDRLLVEARILLQYTHLNISEISFHLGFREVAHFCNFFKKGSTVTPLQYRKVSTADKAGE